MKFEPKGYKIEQLLYAEQRLKKMLERKNKHEATLRQVIKEKEALFLFNNEDNKRIEEIIESINYGSTNDIDFLWIETFIAMVKTSSFQKIQNIFHGQYKIYVFDNKGYQKFRLGLISL